jgi:hypothetical protein
MNPNREILKQIPFKRMDDGHKRNAGMLINFNYIMKYRVHTRYVTLTYTAAILARQMTPDDGGRVRPKQAVRKKGD